MMDIFYTYMSYLSQDVFKDVSLAVHVRTVLVFAVVFCLIQWLTQTPKGIPPLSGWVFPLLGNLPLLARTRGDILVLFRSLRQKHGDIFSFYMGRRLTIVLNGYDVIQHAMVRNGTRFSGRSQEFIGELFAKGKGLIFSSGEFWKRQRKFVTNSLQDFGFGKSSFESKILTEVSSLLQVLEDANERPIDISEPLHVCVSNVIFSIVCGRRYAIDDKKLLMLLKGNELAGKQIAKASVLNNCFPGLRYLPWDVTKLNAMNANLETFQKEFSTWYNEHVDDVSGTEFHDLMGQYIKEIEKQKKENVEPEFTYDQLEFIVMDLFGAGSETSATTIRWALLYIMTNPAVKDRLIQEIDSVLEGDRLPSLQDRDKLPYVEAFIMEVLRIANVAPLALPHSILGDEEMQFLQFRIPKDTTVIVNLDSVLMDPNVFPEPEKFKPERFLDETGKLLKPREFIPFGIGRRVCLGEVVAKMELFLFLTAMLRKFDFQSPKENAVLDLDGVLGVTYSPKPYKVRPIARMRQHIE